MSNGVVLLSERDWQTLGQLVAVEEERAYQATLTGVYGNQSKQRALKLGLAGIVYYLDERPRQNGWDVYDEITGERSFRPYPNRKRSA